VGKKAGLKVVNAGKERFGKKARSFPLPVDVGGCVGRNLAGGGENVATEARDVPIAHRRIQQAATGEGHQFVTSTLSFPSLSLPRA
jgi:hypothetical protein